MDKKKENEYLITVEQLAKEHGFSDENELILSCGLDNIVPACCRSGCEVEPDGTCQHGCPSVIIAMGMI